MTRLRLRQFAALMTTLALLAGLPWLATFLSWPTLDSSLLTWEVRLRSGSLPVGVGTAALIVASWATWGLYLSVLCAEVIGRLRRRPLRLGPLRPLQLLAATSLGTITLVPAVAHATPNAVVVADAAGEVEDDERESGELTPAEPFVVDRARVLDSFGYDSADLTDAMAEDVETTADLIAEHGALELPIVVTGHTDAAGDPDYNRDLSERRAEAVAEALRTRLSEDVLVEMHGAGDTALLDGEDDAAQRRVEISYGVVVTPPVQSDTPSEPGGADTADEGDEGQGPEVGLSLPGGLILAMTTAGLGALGGMALERRHDLVPSRRSDQGEQDDDSEDTDTRAPTPPTDESPSEARHPLEELELIDLARSPGLGITGPGAHGAALTLLARALETSEDDLNVVVPSADLRTLLEHHRRPPLLDEDAAVMVTDTVEDALTLLQLQVLARHRADDDEADDEAFPTREGHDGPQFVLLARAEVAVAAETSSLLAHTEGAPLSAVLLGPWPDDAGATCTIDAHGTITQADEPFADVVDHQWALTTIPQLVDAMTRHSAGTPPPSSGEATDLEDEEETQPDPSSRPAPSAGAAEPHHAGAVSVTVLGRTTLAVQGQQVRPNRKAAYEVLAYLAAHPTGARLEAAVDAMWPHDAPHRTIRRFHDACTSVRSACRPLLGDGATAVITHDGDLYQLNPDLVVCDLWRLESLLEEATHSEDPGAVTAAVAMFDADFVSTADYVWAEGVRTRVRNQLVFALIEHAERETSSRAISMLRRALRINPTSEVAVRNLAQRYDAEADKRSADRVRSAYEAALEEVDTSA